MTTSDTDAQPPGITAARVLVQALAALGVRDAVLSPGSRSAPLAFALAEASLPDDERPAHAPAIRLHVVIDERSAGFRALGLSRGSAHAPQGPAPVLVVTTSGSAVAHLHPAVLEAHHSGVPLILLTADRPAELRGTGANQTTDQVGLFGAAVRLCADVPAPTGRPGEARDLRHLASRAVAAATGARTLAPGPVQLNLAFREPLVPVVGPWPEPSPAGLTEVQPYPAPADPPPVVASEQMGARALSSDVRGEVRRTGDGSGTDAAGGGGARWQDEPTVVVAGDGAGPQARRLAEAQGWPLLAEPSSLARGGLAAIAAYRLLLAERSLGGAVRRAVVLGRPTLSRPVNALLARDDVEVVVVAPQGADWPDAVRGAGLVVPEVPDRWRQDRADPQWLARWRAADDAAAAALDALLAAAGPRGRRTRSAPRITGPALARAVAQASRPDDVLVVGASNPIRDLDLMARWDTPPLVLASRGLAGIDGTVSFATGVALALPHRRVRVLVGDLTFLHDVGGLLRGRLEAAANLQIIVANDEGGSIFATLEPGAREHERLFERVFGTPHDADLAALAAGYGVRHVRVLDADELAPALAAPGTGVSVVEVRVDRIARRALGEAASAAVRAAVAGLSTDS